MKLELAKYSIRIIPENEADEVYLETVLNLPQVGNTAKAKRIAPFELSHAWAYLEIRKER